MQRGQTALPKSMRQANHIPQWTTSPALTGKMNFKKGNPTKGNLGRNQIEAETAKVDQDFLFSFLLGFVVLFWWVFFIKTYPSLIRLLTDGHLSDCLPLPAMQHLQFICILDFTNYLLILYSSPPSPSPFNFNTLCSLP